MCLNVLDTNVKLWKTFVVIYCVDVAAIQIVLVDTIVEKIVAIEVVDAILTNAFVVR